MVSCQYDALLVGSEGVILMFVARFNTCYGFMATHLPNSRYAMVQYAPIERLSWIAVKANINPSTY